MSFHSIHIHRRINELSAQYKVLSEKIEKLRVGFAIETDVTRKFQVQKQLEDSEGERESLEKEISFLEKEYGTLPSVTRIQHNLPQPTYHKFVGFQNEFDILRGSLRPNSPNYLLSIDGPGGVGKSALAIQIAYYYLENYTLLQNDERFDAIIWISAKSSVFTVDGVFPRAKAARTLRDIYFTISITLNREDITKAPIEEQDELVRSALAQQRSLVIIDNLNSIDDSKVNAFLREVPSPTKVLVTSVQRLSFDSSVHLQKMSNDEGLELINTECDRKQLSLSEEEKKKLLLLTGSIPLAIVWSVAQIAYGFSVASVLSQLKEPTGDIVRFCLEEIVNTIHQQQALDILKIISFFESDVSKNALSEISGHSSDELDRYLVDLERLSLINKNWDRIAVLALTKSYLRGQLVVGTASSDKSEDACILWAVNLVRNSSPLGVIDADQITISNEYENILGVVDWCQEHNRSVEISILVSHICLFLYRKGLWHELLELSNIGIKACQKIGDNLSLAWIHLYVILVYIYRRDLDQAEQLCKETQKIIDELPDVSDELKESLEYRKITLQRRKKLQISEDEHQYQLDLARKSNDPSRIISALSRLADFYPDERSNRYLLDALEIAQKASDNTLAARVLSNMARKARENGDLELAKEKINQAIASVTDVVTSVTSAFVALEAAYIHKELGDKDICARNAEIAQSIFSRLGMINEADRCKQFLSEL